MRSTICPSCCQALQTSRKRLSSIHQQKTTQSTLTRPSRVPPPTPTTNLSPSELSSLLSKPTWSVRSLLPTSTTSISETTTPTVTPQTLSHLLRLSALPQPTSKTEEAEMLATLTSQLHFVRAIQGIDTTNITPLRVIRDETAQGLREQMIGLAELQEALDAEDVVGHAKRPRRRRTTTTTSTTNDGGVVDSVRDENSRNEEEDWDVLGGASETVGGRYFVVRSGGGSK
ncbi:hypothetical protein F5Y16DRAFT_336708 [Xylariaceae sp. FL0255]|nr:hypothetical protein F5Y16DRAFT_336708 [Xylariaceae sp. FL0255]